MKQIHHVQEGWRDRTVIDPDMGLTTRRERLLKRADDDRIVHPVYGTFEVQPDGSFQVPDELAAELTRMPGWHEGPNPFPADDEAEDAPASVASKPRRAKAAA